MTEILIALISLLIGGAIGAFFMSLFKASKIKELQERIATSAFWHRRYLDATQFISVENLRKLRKMAIR